MKKKITLLFIALFICVGCATVKPAFQKSEHKQSSSFQIGIEQTANIGEPMVVEENLHFYNGLVATTDYQLPTQLGVAYPVIKRGTMLKLYGYLGNSDSVYEVVDGERPRDMFGKPVMWGYCIAVNPAGQAYGVTPCANDYVSKWSEPVDFLKEEKFYTKDSFKMELIYNGKSTNTIKLLYREFNDNMIRPAFSQELSYDLAESKTIGFRKMTIDIIEATNSHIKFIVKSSMN